MSTHDVISPDDDTFRLEIEKLIDASEQTRLDKMRKHSDRSMLTTVSTLILICVGSGFFGWFFLVSGQLALAMLSLFCTVLPPIFLNSWVQQPLRDYKNDYKTKFMPALAKTLGGLKYHPSRGISMKILSKTGIVPAFGEYKAEDFFMGKYKDVKIMFSEARLTHPKKKNEMAFEGLFVLLELPEAKFEGHNVLTANKGLAKRLSNKLAVVNLPRSEHSMPFTALSTKPDSAGFLTHPQLLKEVYETHILFGKSALSAAFFRGKYIFMIIPNDEDMFEASNVFLPVTTKDAAMRAKKEVEQILSVIDILEIYKDGQTPPATTPADQAPTQPASAQAETPMQDTTANVGTAAPETTIPPKSPPEE